MKKILLLLLLLTGCAQLTPPTQLVAPQSIDYNNKNYYLISQNDLGSVVRYLYVGQGKSPTNWDTAIEILLDRDQQRSFDERIALRKKAYANQSITDFSTYEQQGFLYNYVIYAPTQQNPNWQIDIAKGKNVENCGFIQYQYSLKLEKTQKLHNMNEQKLRSYFKKYAINKELRHLQALPWQWKCQQ
ncbi:hypothetical protein EV694_1424 [Volucribacter psittacicida]|uniref:ATPases of ABC transporters with duplicated ATPase domains-containing protein n=1 Tax=Volucribacter psittacicida TaxID=203482 RepID=A0A4V2PBL8_9PAST|nr:hypothetical protein [Volucribacter psittacicida]TCJ97835.1 hypothetical protein EV694_1424 [Volucribacter psittacicida]